MGKVYRRISNEGKASDVARLVRDAVTARPSIEKKSRQVKAAGDQD